jgi:predicted flap endonuclease-1-like 5' DNA nuclease
MAKLIEVEGIGEVYAQKLGAAGIKTLAGLLKKGGTPEGRKEIAAKSGIGDALILEWVNHADLFRIKGIGGEYADLLEEAGVDTVVELSKRNAENLTAKVVQINTEKKLVRRVPSLKQVTRWIEEAKTLQRAVSY